MTKEELKKLVVEEIEKNRETILEIGKQIYHNPEFGYKEFKTTELVANFTEEVASVIGKEVNVNILINRFNRLKKELSEQELPVTREEFENRAMLFQFINDLEIFIKTKNQCYIR